MGLLQGWIADQLGRFSYLSLLLGFKRDLS